MTGSAICVEGLGKRYRIKHARPQPYVALRDVIVEKAREIFFRLPHDDSAPPREEDFWALRDVSFEVGCGEVLGIIGPNGAGKSTLLKTLSRITAPTEGRIELNGRVASLLEVGTGFHPELTGRENIFLNGAILGMTRAEIARKFDEIVAFAEVETFLDTPVKRYSSGMYVRLAFAVAAHLEPEILIVDEVLAVGDAEFQKKCLGKMRAVAKSEKRTVLFVSHNMAAIETLCNRALFLRAGRLAGAGDVSSQISSYLHYSSESLDARTSGERSLSRSLTLQALTFAPNPAKTGQSVTFVVSFLSTHPDRMLELAILIYSNLGVRVAILDLRNPSLDYRLTPGKPMRIRGNIGVLPLVEGNYSVGLYINCGDFVGDIYDLTSIFVAPASAKGGVPPYSPHDRGLLEFSFDFGLD